MNAQNIDYDKLQRQVDAHPYPLVFATISGAHLYGFPSADSDFDLRGVHLLPLEKILGLDGPECGGKTPSRRKASTMGWRWTSLPTMRGSSSA